MTAATTVMPQPLAVVAPVSVDYAAMSLIVRRPDAAGGYERLLWRESHAALAKAQVSGWPASTPYVWAGAPHAYQFAQVAPGPNLTLLVAFMVGTSTAKTYAELVGKPGLFAFVTADKSARHFLGVTFRHRPQ